MIDALFWPKIIVFLKSFLIIFIFFLIPGFSFRTILKRTRSSIKNFTLGLDFTLGYSMLIIPGLLSYFLHLYWNQFFLIWLTIIIIITGVAIFFLIKRRFWRNSRIIKPAIKISPQLVLSILGVYLVVAATITLFFRGGHFIGDHQHHLAYIIKLLYNDVITPYVPMYEGATEIPYNYAYNLNFLFSAIIIKLTNADLNLYWDIAPSLFFIFAFSANYYLFKKLSGKYRAAPFFFAFVFVFYELHNWGPMLDAEYMPIPDQFARTVFLPVFFGLFMEARKNFKLERKWVSYVPCFVVITAIIFTHVYSYMVIAFVFMAFMILDLIYNEDSKQKANTFILYVSLMFFSLAMFFLRSKNTTLGAFNSSLYSIIDSYFYLIIFVILILSAITICIRPVVDKICFKLNGRKFRIASTVILLILMIAASYLGNKFNGRFIRSVPSIGKYANFLRNYEFSAYQVTGFFLSIILFLFLLLPRIGLSGTINQKGFTLRGKYYTQRKFKIIENGVVFLFMGMTIVMLYANVPSYNVFVSKFVSQTYARRFVSFQETFFIFLFALVLVALYRSLMKVLKRLYFNYYKRGQYLIGILLFVPLTIGLTLDLKDRLNDQTWNRDYILKEDNVFDYIRENVEPWSVIASYKYVAMDVVAQTPNYFISSVTPHSPEVPDERVRQTVTQRIFSWKNNLDYVLMQLKNYNASYILTEPENRKYPPKYDLATFNKNIEKSPIIFKRVYIDNDYLLYEINYKE